MSGRAYGGGAAIKPARDFASGEAASEIQLDSSPILSRLRHSRSRLRYQNKSSHARNPASYAGYPGDEVTDNRSRSRLQSFNNKQQQQLLEPLRVLFLTLLLALNLVFVPRAYATVAQPYSGNEIGSPLFSLQTPFVFLFPVAFSR